jgi:hypothetical protein
MMQLLTLLFHGTFLIPLVRKYSSHSMWFTPFGTDFILLCCICVSIAGYNLFIETSLCSSKHMFPIVFPSLPSNALLCAEVNPLLP